MTALTELYKTDHRALVYMLAKEYGLASGDGSSQFLNPHRMRREAIAQRLRLYRDDARVDFERMIGLVFENDVVREQRKRMIDMASEQNITARITNEVASLYNQPAMRSFKDDDALTERLRVRAAELGLDEVMKLAHRLTFLCNEVLVWAVAAEDGESPELHIVTPDAFDAVPHPANKLRPAGYIIDACPSFVPDGADRAKLKHYEIWDDAFTYHLNNRGELLGEPVEHKLGRIPGVLYHHMRPVDHILDSRIGKDIISAHLGAVLLEIMIMRLAKSQGERQPLLSGNLAAVASGQIADGERPLALPPDVIATMLDSKTSPEHFILAKKDKIDSIEDTYGIPPKGTATDTGAAFVARRLKLTELREEQRIRAREHEKQTVELIGFPSENLRVDHAEQMVPADAMDEIELLKEKLRLGLDSVVAYLMRKDPDLTRASAILLIKSNVRDWAMLITELRVLNMPADASADSPGKSPQQNGADNAPPPNDGSSANDKGTNDGSGTPIAEYAS